MKAMLLLAMQALLVCMGSLLAQATTQVASNAAAR
jgi:hypothetical protein